MKWKADPVGVKILDVRTPEEYMFVEHAPMVFNIPWMFLNDSWYKKKNEPMMKPNRNFISQVQAKFKTTNTILVM